MKKHVIEKGENLEEIAKKYKITVENIIEDNKIKDRARLGVGNILKIRETEKSGEKTTCNKNSVDV